MELQVVMYISEYSPAAVCSEPEVQVFLKQLKQLPKVQYVIKTETVTH
jgi:hypothetical protein